jgi:hypothetical protein
MALLCGVEMKYNIDVLEWRKVNYQNEDKDDRGTNNAEFI